MFNETHFWLAEEKPKSTVFREYVKRSAIAEKTSKFKVRTNVDGLQTRFRHALNIEDILRTAR